MKAITKQKTLAEIEKMLEKDSKVFLVGCGTCATMCRTGGKDEVLDMASKLADLGKTVTGSVVIPTVCDALDQQAVAENTKAIEEADCILVMACALWRADFGPLHRQARLSGSGYAVHGAGDVARRVL